MGKGDALEKKVINLTIPKKWYDELDKIKVVYGALSVQDVIRSWLAEKLEKQVAKQA